MMKTAIKHHDKCIIAMLKNFTKKKSLKAFDINHFYQL